MHQKFLIKLSFHLFIYFYLFICLTKNRSKQINKRLFGKYVNISNMNFVCVYFEFIIQF